MNLLQDTRCAVDRLLSVLVVDELTKLANDPGRRSPRRFRRADVPSDRARTTNEGSPPRRCGSARPSTVPWS